MRHRIRLAKATLKFALPSIEDEAFGSRIRDDRLLQQVGEASVFSRVLFGTRISLTVGVAARLTATLIGVVVGVIAGYRWIDPRIKAAH